MTDTQPLNNVRIIKRYSNRKLYDPTTKSYVTLQGIKQLMQEGLTIQVVDNDSGEDISRQTLAKILVEDERQHSGGIPLNVLRDMVVKSRDSLRDYWKKSIQTGWDTVQQLETDVQKQFQKLIDKGAASEEEVRKVIVEVGDRFDKQKTNFEDSLENVLVSGLSKLNILTLRDLEPLIDRLEVLEARIARLEAQPTKSNSRVLTGKR